MLDVAVEEGGYLGPVQVPALFIGWMLAGFGGWLPRRRGCALGRLGAEQALNRRWEEGVEGVGSKRLAGIGEGGESSASAG